MRTRTVLRHREVDHGAMRGTHAPLDLEAKDLLNQIGNQLQAAGFGRSVHKVSADEWNKLMADGGKSPAESASKKKTSKKTGKKKTAGKK